MSTFSDAYTALIEAGHPPLTARIAAETIARYAQRIAEIETTLVVLKWTAGATLALVIPLFLKVCFP